MKARQKLFTILALLFAVILIAGFSIIRNMNKNIKIMNRCVDTALTELQKNYTLIPCPVGEFENIKLYGLIKFKVEQFSIEQLGNLAIMRVNMGFMQMSTMVITPQDKNMPLFSADYMYIMGNRKAYLEFYDVVQEKDEAYQQLLQALLAVQNTYQHLSNIEVEPAWYAPLLTVSSYKSGTADADIDLENMWRESLAVYLEHAQQLPLLADAEKKQKASITRAYTDGLIEKGGVSTDVFKKQLGEAKTKEFFDTVLFSTDAQ